MAKNNYIPGTKRNFDEFPKIDIPDIEKKAKIDASMGAEISADNLPSRVHKLEHKLSRFQRIQKDRAQEYFHECQEKIGIYNHDFDANVIKDTLLGKTKNNSNLNLDDEENILDGYHQNFVREKKNFIKFRNEHSRTLLPNNADPDETRFQTIFLLLLIIIELAINIGMLQAGGKSDIIATTAVSATQTFWNIVGCYLVGKIAFGSFIHGENITKKLSYGLLISLQFFTILVVNFNMGFFRQAIVNQGTFDTEQIKNVIQIDFWNHLDMQVMSLLAVLVGIIFAFLAYIDGYKSDDPYPGYGNVFRKMIIHKKNIQAKIRDINKRWNANLSNYHDSFVRLTKNGADSISLWSHAINDIEQVREDYFELIKRLDERYQKAIATYESMYNRFANGKKINLKQVNLLKKEQYDMNKEFADVKDFFMTDNQRLKEESAKKSKFSKDMDIIGKEIEKINQTFADKVKNFQTNMTQALIKYFLIIFILFSSFVNAKPSYTKNVQVRLDYFTKSCTNNKEDAFKNSPSKRPNTLILIDATNPLDESQKQFIRDNFLDGFEWGSVGEKVTVVLLNDESLSNLDFFTICTPLPKSKITKTMAFATLNELVDGFHQGLSGGFEELTKSTKEADKSKIIEALVEIFRNKRYNFLEGERRLIIASDLYQNSENLTFLDFCGTKSCQTFDQTLKDNNKFKTFLESVVSLKGANQVKVDIFHLKTHNRINLKSRNWWEGFLKHSGFSEGNVKVTTQL